MITCVESNAERITIEVYPTQKDLVKFQTGELNMRTVISEQLDAVKDQVTFVLHEMLNA